VKNCCESGNEPPGSTKCGEFREYIRNLSPPQEALRFIQSVSLGRFISSFSLSMTGTSAHTHPIIRHEGPEVEQRYSFTLSLTSALDGVGGQRHALAALPPEKTRYPLYRGLGGPQGRSGRVRNSPPPGFDPRTL